jgi:hypothetical protein
MAKGMNMTRSIRRLFATLFLATTFVVPSVSATEPGGTDRVKLDRTVISGNQELPKVLYILPWESKESRPALDPGLELYSGDVLAPVNPASHRRQLDQLEALRGAASSR